MYYSNHQIEEFDNYLTFLDLEKSETLQGAKHIFIDLEKEMFKDYPQYSFANHIFDTRELRNRFDSLIHQLSNLEKGASNINLFIKLISVESSVAADLQKWSYFNHKFAASQGKDTVAMEEWHKLEGEIEVERIAEFKARREANMALYLDVIHKHNFFTQITFASAKAGSDFGLDIAEEQYIMRTIREHKAEKICFISEPAAGSILLNLLRQILRQKQLFSIKGHVISSSQSLDHNLLKDLRFIFAYLGLQESDLANTDFALIINDLDLLSTLPYIDTEKPIFALDLSHPQSPNFAYILLKDEGFTQIYSYAKLCDKETYSDALIRSLCAGLISFISGRNFVEQIAINYMDNYFIPLSKAVNKPLHDFGNSIGLLETKLESMR